MSGISATFSRCRSEKRAAFIPFLVGGDPDPVISADLLLALAQGGADLIEVGVPFSDPIADGPVNQRAATRSLRAGTNLSGILDLVSHFKSKSNVPVVLFSYLNPLLARGIERFADQAAMDEHNNSDTVAKFFAIAGPILDGEVTLLTAEEISFRA